MLMNYKLLIGWTSFFLTWHNGFTMKQPHYIILFMSLTCMEIALF